MWLFEVGLEYIPLIYAEMLASLNRSPPSNQNRERRVRYQHPKGAPDADLIFGSGSK